MDKPRLIIANMYRAKNKLAFFAIHQAITRFHEAEVEFHILWDDINYKDEWTEKINKLEAKLNFANNPKQLIQKINAFNPSPGLHYLFRGKLIKIWQAEIAKEDFHNHKYGYFSVQSKRLFLGVKGGAIEIKEIQIEGKSKMSAIEFIDGYQIDHQELLLNE